MSTQVRIVRFTEGELSGGFGLLYLPQGSRWPRAIVFTDEELALAEGGHQTTWDEVPNETGWEELERFPPEVERQFGRLIEAYG